MATTNPYGKARRSGQAYAVYASAVLPGWEWHVLKVNVGPSKVATNPLASAFCEVFSPMLGQGMSDMGDTYVREIGEVLVRGEDVLRGVPRVTLGAKPPLDGLL